MDGVLKNKKCIFGRKLPLTNSKAKKDRIWELDFIRGICVLLMIWDHFMYDIADIFGSAWQKANPVHSGFYDFALNYESSMLREIFHPIIFSLFFILCGISCNLSRNNLKRGVQVLFVAFAITAVTSMFDTSITFGVLHMLAFSILIYFIISKVCCENKKIISMVCLIAGVVIWIVTQVYSANPPDNLNSDLAFIADYFGGASYSSADYFPILPNLAYVLLGASIGTFVYGDRKSILPVIDKYGWHKPVSFWGNKALLVYILHQPLIILLLSLISYLFITPGNFVFIWLT